MGCYCNQKVILNAGIMVAPEVNTSMCAALFYEFYVQKVAINESNATSCSVRNREKLLYNSVSDGYFFLHKWLSRMVEKSKRNTFITQISLIFNDFLLLCVFLKLGSIYI